jgi:hypothetical protein
MKKRQTLETLISSLLSDFPETATFDLTAFELWGNARDGFDCNDSWCVGRDVPRDAVAEHARGRWEVFKVNYLPKARVSDIADINYHAESGLSLEVDYVPFLDIRPASL